MCSILCSNLIKDDYDKYNFYLEKRGPDSTNTIKIGDYTFLHNLLSMTGDFVTQPFVENDIICLYNGEIYNYKDYGSFKSDGECLIPMYKEFGDKFIKKLIGEFAIILFDLKNEKLIISSDIFKTKPLFYSTDEGNFGCSTFCTPLEEAGHKNVIKMPPNTTRVFDLKSLELIEENSVYDFDLNQHKDTFDDWNIAFKNSIKRRTQDFSRKIFIGLSSGYDSGGICLELLNQNIPFKAYSVVGTENDEIFNYRWKCIENSNISTYEKLHKSDDLYNKHHKYVLENVEKFQYTIDSVCPYTNQKTYTEYWNMSDDYGAKWLSYVCSHAKNDDRKMYLSGMGADELFSDYGFRGTRFMKHSNFGGNFPDDLKSIFPWNSFYGSSMESYLAKEEYIGGSYGLEARYPYLDVDVVQEFLWLSPELKNSVYKSVIDNYLEEHNFPFCKGEKRGF